MAADTSALKIATVTLTAATNHSVNLTGGPSPCRRIELFHHGDETDVIYYKGYVSEPTDDLTGGGAEEEDVIGAGERFFVNVPPANDGSSAWLEFISAGTPTITVRLMPEIN